MPRDALTSTVYSRQSSQGVCTCYSTGMKKMLFSPKETVLRRKKHNWCPVENPSLLLLTLLVAHSVWPWEDYSVWERHSLYGIGHDVTIGILLADSQKKAHGECIQGTVKRNKAKNNALPRKLLVHQPP